MPNFSYGPEVQNRVQQLLEILIDCANSDLDTTQIRVKLDARWEEENQKNPQTYHLAVETTLEDLRVLFHGSAKVPDKVKKTQRKEIGTFLTHYLGENLGVWQDRRVKKRGSSRWIFSLKLWSKDKTQNLREFQQQWDRKLKKEFSRDTVVGVAPPCLPYTDFGATTEGLPLQDRHFSTDSAPSFTIEPFGKGGQGTTPPPLGKGGQGTTPPPLSKGGQGGFSTVGLENIAEIPVWVGRDALIEELKAKLLAPETAPKVLAIIGQGGIGKTSLGVKLLESLGVQLQPPTLTETCPYQKVLYFKVYPGTSFDSVAEFLLRGLDMETAEPLKTAAEKISQILAGLTKQRGVVLLDNLEDILHPANHQKSGKAVSEEWGQLLHRLVYGNHCSTVILTSREFPVDLADSRVRTPKPDPKLVEMLTLVGVEDEDGVEILRQRGSADSDADKQWIAERVKGNTFVLTQLATISAESPGYLRKHPKLVMEEAEPILQAQLMRQTQAGRDLLQRMCVLRVGIDIPGLAFLRLYTDDLEKDYRFEIAAILEEPAPLTKAELKETEKIVRHLVNSSLVQRRYDKKQCEWYYDLHPLIVEYLQTAYQAELPQLMERIYKFYCTGKTVEKPKTLEDLRPLLEAQYFAFQLGNYREASTLLGTTEKYLEPWGYWNLLKDLYEQILPHVDEDTRPYYLQRMGWRYWHWGNWDAAEKYYQDGLKIAQVQNDRSLVAGFQGQLGDIERLRGNWEKAENLYRQSLELSTELGDRAGMAESWGVLGSIARNRGNWDEAEKLYRQCLELRTELGDRAGMATSWGVLGDIEQCRGRWEKAEKLYRQCLEIETELGDRAGMATSWGVLGDIARNLGNWDIATNLYRQSLELRTELGDRAGMAISWGCLGENELGKGNLDEAEKYLTEALAEMEELGMTQKIAETNFDLAQLWRQLGNEEIAQQHYQKSHQLYQKLGAMKDLERIEREWNV